MKSIIFIDKSYVELEKKINKLLSMVAPKDIISVSFSNTQYGDEPFRREYSVLIIYKTK